MSLLLLLSGNRASRNVTVSQLVRAYVGQTQVGATLDDSSASNVDGTITNGTQTFDGGDLRKRYTDYTSSGYADLGATPAIPATSAFTVACWVWGNNLTSYRPAFCQAVIGDGVWIGARDGNPYVLVGAQGIHTQIGMQPAVSVSDDAWHHLALTRSGAVWKLYLDGSLVDTVTDADATRSVYQCGCLIGAWGFATYNTSISFYWDGRIADMIIDNIALPDVDIAWLANDENFLI